MTLKIGVVVKVHPEDRSVDVVMVEDGSRLAGVQVLGEMLSDRAGHNDLHETGAPADGEQWSVTAARDRQNTIAVLGYVGRMPVVVGFLSPQVSQLLFDRADFRVERHPSDVYSTVDKAGNVEFYHPSGTFLRFALDPEHEDLTGKDVDGKWKIDRNTQSAPWVSLWVKNAGAHRAKLRIDPAGNVSLDHVGNLTTNTGGNASATVAGNATVNVGGTTDVTSGGNAHLTCPQLTVTSPQSTFTGHVTIAGGLAVSGGEGAVVTGNLAAEGGSFTHNSVNVGSSHTHTEQGDGAEVSTPH